MKEILDLPAGELILGINHISVDNKKYLTINRSCWDDEVLIPPPVFYVNDQFMKKCTVEKTTKENANNQHFMDNYLAISTRRINGTLDYLFVPEINWGDLLGMSLGETICLYEYTPSVDIYKKHVKFISLKLYHKVLHKNMLLWMQLNVQAFVYRENILNGKCLTDIMEADVRIK